jgi:hypothetical protein
LHRGKKSVDSVSIALDFANTVNLIAVLLLMRAVIKDRNVLRGFSVSGTLLTSVAICGLEVGFFLLGNSVSFGLGLVSLVFWVMAFSFSFRKFIRERNGRRKTDFETKTKGFDNQFSKAKQSEN